MSFNISKYHFRSNRLFDSVVDPYLKDLNTISESISFQKGDELYKEGSIPKAVYRVKKGKVKVNQITEEGNSRIIYIYASSEFFGFRPLLCNEKIQYQRLF